MRQTDNSLDTRDCRLGRHECAAHRWQTGETWMAWVLILLALVMGAASVRAQTTLPEGEVLRLNAGCTFSAACGNASAASGTGQQSQSSTRDISRQQLRKIRIAGGRTKDVAPSPDSLEEDWGNGFSTFLTVGAKTLRHRANPYEEGYDSTTPGLTLGGDYRFADTLIAGMAFNYSNWNGNFDTAGGFNINAYGPLFFVSYAPLDRVFIDASAGYLHQDNLIHRFTQVTYNKGGSFSSIPTTISGVTTANYNSNFLHANLRTGYYFQFGDWTISPRVGVNVQRWLVDNYRESGSSGLELSYTGLDQFAIQSSLGAQANLNIPVSFGTVIPYVAGNWLHEFANHQRVIKASFVADPDNVQFPFNTEAPARDWAVIDVGVSILTTRNVSGIVSFSTIQGNRRVEGYGGSVGIRVAW